MPKHPDQKIDFKSMNQYERVAFATEQVLKTKKVFGPESAMSGKEIYEGIQSLFPKLNIPPGTFNVSITTLVKDENSPVNCKGKKQGYYYSNDAKDLEEKQKLLPEKKESVEEIRIREKEKLLYPAIKNWLLGQGYHCKVTATGKGHGWWGNPDITGIKSDDSMGMFAVEVTTLEVKLTHEGWQQWIFEAVSHKRFSNRSYFAFAYPDALVNKLPAEMRYYSELYNIGVLAVLMEQELYDSLTNGQVKTVEDDEVEIMELYSAPYTHIQPFHQMKFLNSLKIGSQKEIFTWGESPIGSK